MLIALCIVATLLAASLIAHVLLFVESREFGQMSVQRIDSLLATVAELERKAEALADDLAFAESLIDEYEDDYDALSRGVLDAMDDLAGARDTLDCALDDLAGSLDRDECDCDCCCDED